MAYRRVGWTALPLFAARRYTVIRLPPLQPGIVSDLAKTIERRFTRSKTIPESLVAGQQPGSFLPGLNWTNFIQNIKKRMR